MGRTFVYKAQWRNKFVFTMKTMKIKFFVINVKGAN